MFFIPSASQEDQEVYKWQPLETIFVVVYRMYVFSNYFNLFSETDVSKEANQFIFGFIGLESISVLQILYLLICG